MLPGRQISCDAGKHSAKPSAHDPADTAGSRARIDGPVLRSVATLMA
jgi:hypothetical protein